jgi:hypothetical protein
MGIDFPNPREIGEAKAQHIARHFERSDYNVDAALDEFRPVHFVPSDCSFGKGYTQSFGHVNELYVECPAFKVKI